MTNYGNCPNVPIVVTQITVREVPILACYLAITSKRGNSQRITLPTKLLKKKKWAKTKMYLLCDHHEGHITLRPYDLDPLQKMIREQDQRTDKK